MRRIRVHFCRDCLYQIFIMLIVFLSYYLSVHYYHLLADYPKTYQVICRNGEESGLTGEEYEAICKSLQEDTAWRCAFWKEERGQQAENPEWSRMSEVTVWKVRGDLGVLFHDFVKLQEEDEEGCYLDEETARELFGSSQVMGESITCGERKLTIRGILKQEKALLVFRPKPDEGTDQITLLPVESKENSSFLSTPQEFMTRFGIQGDCIEAAFLGEIAQVFPLIFPAVLGVSFFCVLRSIGKEQCQKGMKGIKGEMFKLVWWLFLLGFVYLLLQFIRIPEDMIPDQWSNFAFWGNWWEKERTNVRLYFGQRKTGTELMQLQYFGKSLLFAVIPVFLWRIRER